ncbi:hypothetical protein FOA52_006181 [Chlamydomonas sp. UWO 241]|nr:hypothetical protein FOA52_006181 [Chlamydomonas sp. UWO 241]
MSSDTVRRTADQNRVESPGDGVGVVEDAWEHKVALVTATLEAVGSKCNLLGTRLVTAEEESKQFAERFFEAHDQAEALRLEQHAAKEREQLLRHEILRYEALLDAEALQALFTERKLQQMLGQEHVACEQLRAERDAAAMQRDDALTELAIAYADMDAMQATLSDSAVYVRYMRKRVLELELEQARGAVKDAMRAANGAAAEASGQDGVFSMASIKASIASAVADAAVCNEDERRKRIRQLQLRWHPDKNPVLAELATEVTKLINEAVAQHC